MACDVIDNATCKQGPLRGICEERHVRLSTTTEYLPHWRKFPYSSALKFHIENILQIPNHY